MSLVHINTSTELKNNRGSNLEIISNGTNASFQSHLFYSVSDKIQNTSNKKQHSATRLPGSDLKTSAVHDVNASPPCSSADITPCLPPLMDCGFRSSTIVPDGANIITSISQSSLVSSHFTAPRLRCENGRQSSTQTHRTESSREDVCSSQVQPDLKSCRRGPQRFTSDILISHCLVKITAESAIKTTKSSELTPAEH